MTTRPTIFIGSSSEALSLARGIATALGTEFTVQLWDDRLFELGEDTLTGLLRAVLAFDYAILVVSDDDTLSSRRNGNKAIPNLFTTLWEKVAKVTHNYAAPRDNVLFELGLFMGAMGRRRAFTIIAPSLRGAPKIPSDLFGNNVVYLKKSTVADVDYNSIKEELGQLIATVKQRYEQEAEFELLPSTGSAVSYFHNFVIPVCEQLVRLKEVEINGTTHRIARDTVRFRILLPGSLREANRPFATKLFSELPVVPFTVRTEHREYPFWVSTSLEDGAVVFWDYPTILKASDEAVEYVTRSAFLSNPAIRERFEIKELKNFERSLQLLLHTAEAAAIKTNIEIRQSKAL